MAMNVIEAIFEGTRGTGFYEYVLSFLLVFALVYALLDQIDTLGDDNSAVIAVISIAISFFVVYSGLVAPFMMLFAGPLALLLVLVLALMIGAQLAGILDEESWFDKAIGFVAVGGVAALILLRGGIGAVYCSGPSTNLADELCSGLFSGEIALLGVDFTTLLVVALAIGALVWIVRGD